jgi:hypothetical protein
MEARTTGREERDRPILERESGEVKEVRKKKERRKRKMKMGEGGSTKYKKAG